ncbi:tetratricopeptide repeat protein [Arthrobacter sp. Soc17.1.1.1]|uniref:tetratricopeptide repeat protein n=1 Tax=Arthrobacter sp. Soc17.1.1.1 TaxID=3121277 RepID=UPI002FE4D80E
MSSLRRALEGNPADVILRLHLAQMLLASGDAAGAITEASTALGADPNNQQALHVLMSAAKALTTPPEVPSVSTARSSELPSTTGSSSFDWERAEHEIGSAVPPFVQAEQIPVTTIGDASGRYDDLAALMNGKKRR